MQNRTLKDWSAIDNSIKIKDVLREMIDWVITREVESDPYITWLSVGQIQFGNGYHFKKMPKSLGRGLNHHMGFRKGLPASINIRRRHFNICGWDPGAYPGHYPGVIKTWINDRIIKKILAEKIYKGIVPLFAPGYYEPGTLRLTERKIITGYFFALADPKRVKRQTEYIESCWKKVKMKHIPLQFEYAKPAMQKHIKDQLESAMDKIDYKERLREIVYFKKISARRVLPQDRLNEIDDIFKDDEI